MDSLETWARAKLADLESRHLRRRLQDNTVDEGAWVMRGGRRLLSFSSNDYLNLTQHPRVMGAAIEAVRRYGAGAGASRLVTGNFPLLSELESALARFKGTEAACVFGSGYLANIGIVPCLVGPGDIVFIDEFAHSCLWAGAKLSGAAVHGFAHNDAQALSASLVQYRAQGKRALVLVDGVYSMDGDLAPLDVLAPLCVRHDAWLLTDDAHGLGVVGAGRGAAHAFPGVHIALQMGTLSKAAGAYGGYLCASQAVIDLIKTRARSFVYATGLPPAAAGAALAGLDIIANNPALTAKPLANAKRFTRALGLPEAQSAIAPLILGPPERAIAAAEALQEAGFLVVAIRPPTVPMGTSRLRIAFTAAHENEDIDRLADAMRTLAPVRA